MRTTVNRRTALPALLAVLAAALLLLVPAEPAAAHDSLVSADPAADATVSALPAEITLTFSGALIDGDAATRIEVTGPTGDTVTDGEPVVDGALVAQALRPGGPAGAYRVVWRVVSSDGHPVSGEYAFTVTEGTESAVPSAQPTTAQPQQDDDAEPSGASPVLSLSLPWIVGGAVVVLIVAFLIVLAVLRRRDRRSDADSGGSAGR